MYCLVNIWNRRQKLKAIIFFEFSIKLIFFLFINIVSYSDCLMRHIFLKSWPLYFLFYFADVFWYFVFWNSLVVFHQKRLSVFQSSVSPYSILYSKRRTWFKEFCFFSTCRWGILRYGSWCKFDIIKIISFVFNLTS